MRQILSIERSSAVVTRLDRIYTTDVKVPLQDWTYQLNRPKGSAHCIHSIMSAAIQLTKNNNGAFTHALRWDGMGWDGLRW